MKKIISLILTFILLCNFSFIAFADDSRIFYIDSENGSDENTGLTPESAYKTLENVKNAELKAGDKILLKCGGTYTGEFVTSANGEKDNPILFSSYGEGKKPVVQSQESFVFLIRATSFWTFDNIDFTAPEGRGMVIVAYENKNCDNITIKNCVFHDMAKGNPGTDGAAIFVDTDSSSARVNNLTVENCEFRNMSWAIHTKGVNRESTKGFFVSPELSYNRNMRIANCSFRDVERGAIVVCSAKDAVVTGCKAEHCATAQDSAYAPIWIRHSDNVLVEYCEISGASNKQDGMAIDFDGWTINSTYDHIYSHDNRRFVKNCVFDAETRNNGNTVSNCVSVNDNSALNFSAVTLISSKVPSYSPMTGFEFRGNTLVNPSPICWLFTPGAKAHDNHYYAPAYKLPFIILFNFLGFHFNDSYSVNAEGVDTLISEIQSRVLVKN